MCAAELRWDGKPSRIVQNGTVSTVPYRHAVSLVSRGLATWAEEPQESPVKPVKAKRVQKFIAPVLPERTARVGDVLPDLPESAYGPDAVPLEPIVSAPTKSAEGVQTGYEPSPSDP